MIQYVSPVPRGLSSRVVYIGFTCGRNGPEKNVKSRNSAQLVESAPATGIHFYLQLVDYFDYFDRWPHTSAPYVRSLDKCM